MALDLWKSMYLQSCAQKLLCRASFYTKQAFTQSKLLHRVAFIQRSFYAVPAFTRRNCYAEKLLRREAFMQRSFYTEKLVHQRRFYREKLLHTEALTHRTFYVLVCATHFPVLLLYYKARKKDFPVLLCTTKLLQTTFQYFFVVQSLHKVLPSTTVYQETSTKHFPLLLCTTK